MAIIPSNATFNTLNVTNSSSISNLRVENITETNAIVKWDMSSEINCSIAIDTGSGFTTIGNTSGALFYNFRLEDHTTLTKATEYTIRVTPINELGKTATFSTIGSTANASQITLSSPASNSTLDSNNEIFTIDNPDNLYVGFWLAYVPIPTDTNGWSTNQIIYDSGSLRNDTDYSETVAGLATDGRTIYMRLVFRETTSGPVSVVNHEFTAHTAAPSAGAHPNWPAASQTRQSKSSDTLLSSTFPGIGNSVTGPFGATVTHYADLGSTGYTGYSTRDQFNADNTAFFENNTIYELSGATYPILATNSERHFSHSDPDLLIGLNGSELIYWNYKTNTTTVLRDFAGNGSDYRIGDGEGNIAGGHIGVDSYVVISTSTKLISYDIQNDQIINIINRPSGMDNIGFDPTGQFIVMRQAGMIRLDPDLNGAFTFYNGEGHGDRGIDASGNPVWLNVPEVPYVNGVLVFRLADGTCTVVGDKDNITSYDGDIGHHMSGRMLQRPGFFACSGNAATTNTSRPSTIVVGNMERGNTIIQSGTDNNFVNDVYNGVDNWCHNIDYTRTLEYDHGSSPYNHDAAKMTVSKDGSKFLFGSRWYKQLSDADLFLVSV